MSVVARILREIAARTPSDEFERSFPGKMVEKHLVRTFAGETPVFLHRPQLASRLLPVLVSMHGGGFGLGSAADDAVWCQRIADTADCMVVNIDYHLAPEHVFPVALEECYDVLGWLRTSSGELGIDRRRIAVGGHSAGGNLAAALCLLSRQRGDCSIVLQILNAPPLDLSLSPVVNEFRDALLTPELHGFFIACYVQSAEQAKNPLASPLLAEKLAGLPPVLMITAEYDPLRAEQEQYASRLRQAGVVVDYRCFEGCRHAFTHRESTPAATAAWELIASQLRQAFSGGVKDGDRLGQERRLDT